MTVNIYSQDAYVDPDMLDLWDDESDEEQSTNSIKKIDEQTMSRTLSRSTRGRSSLPQDTKVDPEFAVPDLPVKNHMTHEGVPYQTGMPPSSIIIPPIMAPPVAPADRIGTNAKLKKLEPQNTLDFQYRNEKYLRPKGSHHLYFSRHRLESSTIYPVKLVPIRIELDMDNFKFKDAFLWNLYETLLTPEYVAALLIEDIESPYGAQLVPVIGQMIRAQIADYALATQDDPLVSSITSSSIDPKYPDPNDVKLAFSSKGRSELEETTKISEVGQIDNVKTEDNKTTTKEEEEDSMEDIRIMIKLELNVGSIYLKDQFEWSLLESSDITPEEFARQYTAELGLGGEFPPLIAHSIREQVIMNRLQFDVENRAPDDWVHGVSSTGLSSTSAFQVGSAAANVAAEEDMKRPLRNHLDTDANHGLSGNAIMNMGRQFPFMDLGNMTESTSAYAASPWEPEVKFMREEDLEKVAKEQDRSARRARRQRQSVGTSLRTTSTFKPNANVAVKSSPFAVATAMSTYPDTGYVLFPEDPRKALMLAIGSDPDGNGHKRRKTTEDKHEEIAMKESTLEKSVELSNVASRKDSSDTGLLAEFEHVFSKRLRQTHT